MTECCWVPEAASQEEAESRNLPLVPIHSWSCSSLKVSLTLPPDLLYMPDKGTVGRCSWRHRSTVKDRDQKQGQGRTRDRM